MIIRVKRQKFLWMEKTVANYKEDLPFEFSENSNQRGGGRNITGTIDKIKKLTPVASTVATF